MASFTDHHKSGNSVRELAGNETFAVQGWRGTSIRCTHGQVWVTRSGDARDYFLPRGVAFVAAGPGLIVVNGVADANRVQVGRVRLPAVSDFQRHALYYDAQFFSRIESDARRARADAMAALGRRVLGVLAPAWRHMTSRFSRGRRAQPSVSRTSC